MNDKLSRRRPHYQTQMCMSCGLRKLQVRLIRYQHARKAMVNQRQSGSDVNKLHQEKGWRLLPDSLRTCPTVPHVDDKCQASTNTRTWSVLEIIHSNDGPLHLNIGFQGMYLCKIHVIAKRVDDRQPCEACRRTGSTPPAIASISQSEHSPRSIKRPLTWDDLFLCTVDITLSIEPKSLSIA